MQKIFLILCVCFAIVATGQQNAETAEDDVLWSGDIRLHIFYPLQVGNHSLAKSHRSQIGAGFHWTLIGHKNFSAGFAMDFTQYKITDHSLVAAPATLTGYTSAYGTIHYKIPGKRMSFSPGIGIGYVNTKIRSRSKKYGNQDGNEYRAGLYADYAIGKSSSVFLGLHYIFTNLDINTAAEYEDFFGKAHQLQMALGFRL